MRTRHRRNLLIGLCAAALAALACAAVPSPGAAAAGQLNLWVSDSEGEGSGGGDSARAEIACWYSQKERAYALFLPAMMDASRLQVYFEQEEPILIGGVRVGSGDVTDAFAPERTVQVETRDGNFQVRVLQSANLPALWVETRDGSLAAIHANKTNKEAASLLMLDAAGETVYAGGLSHLKSRGNATFRYEKKPYQIKLEKSTDLLGSGKARTWLLLAEYDDYSLLRSKITFEMAEAAGLAYTTRSGHVDLYIDREYKGTYLLCERIEIGKNRISIQDLEKATGEVNELPLAEYPRFGRNSYKVNTSKGYRIPADPADISGGYLLELEYQNRYRDGASGFVTARGQAVNIKEPECASAAQVETIRAHMQAFENAIFSSAGVDRATGKHYSELVDVESLAKKIVIEEIAKNNDANKSSQYYYKPEDAQSPLAFAGPVWDYHSAYGNFAPEHNPGFASPQKFVAVADFAMKYYWWSALYKQPDFYQAVVDTYHEVYTPLLRTLLGAQDENSGRLLSIDAYAAQIEASARMNLARWPIVKRSTHPDTGNNLEENVAYLKDFVQRRMEFLSEAWGM